MSDEPIDLSARRKAKRPEREKITERFAGLYYCQECGGGAMRLWNDGTVECANCAGVLEGLVVSEG